MYEVYHSLSTSQNWTSGSEACYHIFSHYIIPFCGWLLTCHTVKKKNSFSTGTILLLWHFPNTAPATKHPLDTCRSEWLHFHLSCHWGRTSSLPQQREAERTTHFSDSDRHGFIFACEQPQVRLFINYIHHLSRPECTLRGWPTWAPHFPPTSPSQTNKGNLAIAALLQWANRSLATSLHRNSMPFSPPSRSWMLCTSRWLYGHTELQATEDSHLAGAVSSHMQTGFHVVVMQKWLATTLKDKKQGKKGKNWLTKCAFFLSETTVSLNSNC